MFMEPDALLAPKLSIVKSESRVIRQYSPMPERTPSGFVSLPRSNYASISRVENYSPEVIQPQNPVAAEQNFFPSFFRNAPLNAHSRPYKQAAPSTATSIGGQYSASGRSNSFDQSILGSGDFAVVRGGTFYPDDERPYKYKGSDVYFGGFFNNGHDPPKAHSLKQPYYPEDPFKDFKDFADINAGSDPAFSHFIVIYANKNGTKPHPSHPSPKNIFEQLQLLDQENEEQEKQNEQKLKQIFNDDQERENEKILVDKKLMKLRKFKTKLSKTKVVKRYKKKLGPKVELSPDYTDPLLAMS